MELPIVDLKIESTADVGRSIFIALEKYGVFRLVGHGISRDLTCRLRSEAIGFFQLSSEEKMLFNSGCSYGSKDGGYSPPGKENVKMSSLLTENAKSSIDPVESFVFPSICVKAGTEFGTALHEYYAEMHRVLFQLHTSIEVALGLANGGVNQLYGMSTSATPTCSMLQDVKRNGNALKLAYYDCNNPFDDNSNERPHGAELLYGAHTDYQGLTLLLPDVDDWSPNLSGGLEVLIDDGWVSVPGGLYHRPSQRVLRHEELHEFKDEECEDVLLVNAGDFWPIWTDGKWKSIIHRVSQRRPAFNGADREKFSTNRLSVVFFSGPLPDVVLGPLVASDTTVVEGAGVRPGMTAGEYLDMKIAAGRS